MFFKGRISKKRIRSTLETNKPSKRPLLASRQQNTSQEKEIVLQGSVKYNFYSFNLIFLI
jgi:hypothetical protein